MILSAFCLPFAGLSVVSFPAGWSVILAGGLGFLLRFPVAELPEIVHCIGGLIPRQVGMMFCTLEPCVRVFLENCFPFGIGYSYHVFTLS